MKKSSVSILLFSCLLVFSALGCRENETASIEIEFVLPADSAATLPDGRVFLLLSTSDDGEPRFQILDGASSQQVWGMDIENRPPGERIRFKPEGNGYPVATLEELPAGEYYVQGLFHRYETFHLAGGQTVKLPMDRGEGQHWNSAPGNLFSQPVKITVDPFASGKIEIHLDQVIPPIPAPEDTKYIKHIRIQSKLLTAFWGRPMFLGAHILLPEGFDSHPEAKYPLAIYHGHYPSDFAGFSTSPPDPDLKPEYSERFGIEGYNIVQQQMAYDFYKEWTGPGFPRVIAIEIQHSTPYYDDSYAVNSASQGPYGDAITYELIPYIESQFRGIGEGWARFVYGGSTGGWEALAVQVLYPDEYNTCYAACPDPIDFRAYCQVNIYADSNAYINQGPFQGVERPGARDSLGKVRATVRQMNYRELALGTKSRSGEQWDIWEAVYSPQGEDGYPVRIWDKVTGKINPEVAAYWRENYDLTYIMKRDWAELGPKLKGKIHIYCGDMDNYYLNNAVYLAEEFLEETTAPYYDGEVDYGDRAEHCWNGDHTRTNGYSRLCYHQMFIPKWTDWVQKNAPQGADLKSWRY
ncbi:MAG: alpha/beta hydrolase-fold protein [Bacteroidia bacterium]